MFFSKRTCNVLSSSSACSGDNFKFISIFVIGTTNSAQTILEGLENQTDSKDSDNSTGTKLINNSSEIKKKNRFMDDKLLIGKYREDFDKLILDLEEYSNNLMMDKVLSVSELISKDKDNNNSKWSIISEMESVNRIKNFIDSLNTSIKYIERKKN
jgi:hypothetical protein